MGFIHSELFPGFKIGDFSPVVLMGVVNLSPESFYKQSFYPKDQLLSIINLFIKNGVQIIDLGARSTAPNSKPISVSEEKQRITNALDVIGANIPQAIIISIDTQYSEVAELALTFAQAHSMKLIINDVSCFQTDPKMVDIILKYKCPAIIMASNVLPGDTKTVDEILLALSRTIEKLHKVGYDLTKLIIDPGVGKWTSEKTYEYDCAILDRLTDFRCFGCPILVGISRKSFLGTILTEPDPQKREVGSLAATSIAVYNGAHIIRTHDIDVNTVQTIQVASAIRRKPIMNDANNQKCELMGTFENPDSAYHFLRQYGITPAGSRIMKNKMITKIVVLHNITAPQGLILKQEMLARGGDVGLHSQVITTEWQKYSESFNIVLIGTVKQYTQLIEKLRGQQLKLDTIGRLIEDTFQREADPKLNYKKDFSH